MNNLYQFIVPLVLLCEYQSFASRCKTAQYSCLNRKQCPNTGSQRVCGYDRDGYMFSCSLPRPSDDICEAESKREEMCNKMYGGDITPIYGGIKSTPEEFPHMAALGYGDPNNPIWGCGGSLISPNFILTAAHCLNDRNLGKVKFIRLGALKLTDDHNGVQNFEVYQTYKHPNYKRPSKYNDIGLIELEYGVKITNNVKPACLESSFYIDNPSWSAAGWGDLEFQGEKAKHLQKTSLRDYDYSVCRKIFPANPRTLKYGIHRRTQICAWGNYTDACHGDSGGPLQIKNTKYLDGYTIIGVISFGTRCGPNKAPGVYTRVSAYIDWIQTIVWKY